MSWVLFELDDRGGLVEYRGQEVERLECSFFRVESASACAGRGMKLDTGQ